MSAERSDVHEGGCLCGAVRFEIQGKPMFVHACHCSRCQQRSGSAFAVNLWIEESKVKMLCGELTNQGMLVDEHGQSSESWSCASCGFGLWTCYHGAPAGSRFVRAGTLDDPAAFPPDVHIYTRSKQPWVTIPDDVPSFEVYYDLKETWPAASRKRLREMMSK